ncbi:hypothetical protein [Trichothermofontia sp.]
MMPLETSTIDKGTIVDDSLIPLFPADAIATRVKELAQAIGQDYAQRPPYSWAFLREPLSFWQTWFATWISRSPA